MKTIIIVGLFIVILAAVISFSYFSSIAMSETAECTIDADCVPAECCHPRNCVPIEQKPDCSGVICSMDCAGPIDCGAGKCVCKDSKCSVEAITP